MAAATSAVNKSLMTTSWKSKITYQKMQICKMMMRTTTAMKLKMRKLRRKAKMKRPVRTIKMRAWLMNLGLVQTAKDLPLRAVTMKEEDGLDD